MNKLGYDGTPEFSRKRKLSELNQQVSGDFTIDLKPPVGDDREVDADKLFKDLAATYIKGEALKRGLSKMDPAQEIPIDETEEAVIAAARRIAEEESRSGTVVTYSMYQNCISAINDNKWEIRRSYFNPSSVFEGAVTTRHISTKVLSNNNGKNNLLKQFFDENGIAGCILGMLTLSPFQSIVFQALGVEEGAKTSQSIQIPVGIAFLIELGIKAERIKDIMKASKIDVPLVEQQLVRMENPDERATALASVGVDYGDFKKSMSFNDNQTIINYVSQYYSRYGGLVAPGSHLSIDHWIAYLHASENQMILKSALNTADAYSQDFANIRNPSDDQTSSADDVNTFTSKNEKNRISVHIASATRAMRERSDKLYDDILNSFLYNVTDSQICCLVSIFGAYKDTDFIKTIASLLRLLAVDLSGEIVRLDNKIRQFLSNLFAQAIFELAVDVERLLQKVLAKVTKAFTVEIEGLERCVGLLSVGYAVLEAVRILFKNIKQLLKELMSIVNNYGQPGTGAWTVAADRRHLLGIARILEVLAARLDVASVCDQKIKDKTPSPTIEEIKDRAAGEVVQSMIETSPPTIQLSNQEIDKYFKNVQPQVSERLRFNYGIPGLQNLETNDTNTNSKDCTKQISKEEVDSLFKSFVDALNDNG